MANQDLSNIVEQAIESNFKDMGNINILIPGKKSTWINTIFDIEVTQAAQYTYCSNINEISAVIFLRR